MKRPSFQSVRWKCVWRFAGIAALTGSLCSHAAEENSDPLYPHRREDEITLEQCLRETLAANSEIQKNKTRLEEAAGQKLVFQSAALPKLSTAFLGGRQGERFETDKSKMGFFQTASLTQKFFDMGIPAAFRIGRAALLLAQQNLNAVVNKALHNTRLLFYRALHNRALVDLYREREKNLEANLKKEQERFDLGLTSKTALLQAKVQANHLKPQAAEAKYNYFQSLNELVLVLGREIPREQASSAKAGLPFPVGKFERRSVKIDLATQTQWALRERPDLQVLRSLIQIERDKKTSIEAAYYPNASMIGAANYTPPQDLLAPETRRNPDENLVQNEDTGEAGMSIGAQGNWQIDGGSVLGASRSSQALAQMQELKLKQFEGNIARDLKKVALALEVVDQKVHGLQKTVALAEESLSQVETQVALNEATQLDYLEAQTQLLFTQSSLLGAIYDQEKALAELDLITARYLGFSSQKPDLSSAQRPDPSHP